MYKIVQVGPTEHLEFDSPAVIHVLFFIGPTTCRTIAVRQVLFIGPTTYRTIAVRQVLVKLQLFDRVLNW